MIDRLTTKATPEGTLSYTYYPTGQVETIASSNANGVWAAYTYDDAGRLQTVVDNRLSGSNTTTYTYDAADNLTTAAYPNSPGNAPSAFTYDTLDRLTALSTPVSSYNYTLGPAGNLTKAVEGTGRTLNWSYDGIYRLTNEAIAADPNNVNGSVGYILDPVGNRKSANSTLSGVNSSPTVTYTSDDELSTGEGETYDNNGNTLTTGGKTFTYDAENHLMSMTNGSNVVTMVYDGDGNRVAKTAGTVTTSYLVDDVNPTGLPQVMEELVNGAVARSYTYGLDRISENQLVSGAWTASFYGVDGGGSVRQLANSSGTPTDTYEYDAFGNLVDKTGPSQNTYTPNNYLYRGEQYDPDLGLYYLRARYYNPVTGRFLSADPLASEGQRRYQYAGADPVNGVDPTGMDLIELAMLAQYANRVQIPSMDIHSWCGTTVDGQIVGVLPLCGIIIPDFPLFALIPPPQHTVKVCWRSLMKWKKNESQPNAIMGHYKHTYIEIDTIFPGAKPIRETWGVLGYPRPKGKDQEVMHNDPDNSPFGGSGCRPVDCPDSVALDFEATLKATEWTPGSTFHCPSCGKNYRRLSFNSNTYTFNMVTYWTHTVPPPLDDVNAPGYNWDDRYAGYPW